MAPWGAKPGAKPVKIQVWRPGERFSKVVLKSSGVGGWGERTSAVKYGPRSGVHSNRVGYQAESLIDQGCFLDTSPIQVPSQGAAFGGAPLEGLRTPRGWKGA